MQFFSGFNDAGGTRFAILTLNVVARTYVRTWFAIDLVAAIPFDRFAGSSSDNVAIRIPGLIKTVRLLKLKRIMKKWNNLSYGPLLKVRTRPRHATAPRDRTSAPHIAARVTALHTCTSHVASPARGRRSEA